MKHLLFLLLSFSTFAQDIHFKSILVDTHNDCLTACIEKNVSLDQDLTGINHSDLARFKKGGVDYQLFSVWCDGEKANPYVWAMREMDSLYAVAARNSDKLVIAKTWKDIQRALKEQKLVAQFGVEGGHMIENDLQKLETFYNRGVQYMTLTWNNSPSWASSHADEKNPSFKGHKGLNDFGKKVVKKMNQMGMLVDVSHVGEATFWDVINTTTKPIIASHSNAYSVCPVSRNLKDEQIIAIGKNGGVIHLNFYSAFVDIDFWQKDEAFRKKHSSEIDSLVGAGMQMEYAFNLIGDKYAAESDAIKPDLEQLMKHFDHIVKLIGVDHVGLGSDFDGINSAPKQLKTVLDYPVFTQALIARGYSNKDISKVLGGNFLRVYQANH
ncbi:dipeptidase [Aquirufa regiilacus]|uniref:Dipeptidase n=1 Tax=Aquirufa regiilacus TaxID=3024868 RepID=A0ABU3TUU0_9BACT|nr:dipeptidase [Aquirufa sp. LEOWEIH-7C]MDU0809647.1 dipeptidase [Aquirufa sp. LEOWEIH-7C]